MPSPPTRKNHATSEYDLKGIPQVFSHKHCGEKTQMNPQSVRRYLRDPLRLVGVGSSVWCANCRKNVRSADCRWEETGESVEVYFRRLIGRAIAESPWSWVWRFLLLYSVLGLVAVGGAVLACWYKGGDADTTRLIGYIGAMVVVVFLMVAFPFRLLAYRRCAAEYRAWCETRP